MMNAKREELLDRMIRIYGFEHDVVINFARACESEQLTDKALEIIVSQHEKNPWFEDEDEE